MIEFDATLALVILFVGAAFGTAVTSLYYGPQPPKKRRRKKAIRKVEEK